MKLTLAEVAMGAGAVLEAPASVPNAGALLASGYSIDSRTIAPGELFFAVRGERHDGHDFVVATFERGAVAAVVSRARAASLPDAVLAHPLLIAEDPLAAMQALALHVRRQWGHRVVAVTGSAGKTTTKEAVAAALGAKFQVLKSKGNLNNNFGLPLQLLRLMPEHEFAVVEMGMNHSGEIAALARIASPDWGVITNIGSAHIENFADGQAGIARAKFELIEALPANGVAFLNCDDAYAAQFGRDFSGRVVYFGAGPCADPQILASAEDNDGLHVRIRASDRETGFTLQLLGSHNASNAVAGLAVALEAGVDLDAAIAAIASLTAGDKRGEVIEVGGATILNDSYNSNPEALRSMIRTLAARPTKGRRILIAGEMLELGEHAPALHFDCGRAAAQAGLDLVVAVQGNAEHLATAACAGGVPAVFLRDADAAGQWLVENLRPGDVVLIKGSRGVHLERAIEIMTNNHREGQ
ncbi:MAG TPA: UDP-N-acetylmuramoyl-tripeptide--D-alanyl-D-alanine ligase [Terracidiphilus sp.]|jgi:UDP-N-acetylmuramoyl-tripeptide--D-alanyl-D-alanine ligase